MVRFTHCLARDVEFSAHALDILPVLLPLTAYISARFVPGVPIPHKDGGEVIVLLDSRGQKRVKDSLTGRTFSASNLAVTDESTPPDIATTTVQTMSVHLSFLLKSV